ncbi:MAG: ABC transporter ATP-binding protein [Trueperaceae bacterium]|nr:ABC transporter ATP-binding protein [Trueperaceae bacterium]
MILAEGLVKSYGRFRAVDGVDLCVEPGEVVALLGPNGAGKSTTIKSLVGLIRPTAGRVSVCGHDLATQGVKAKASFGYVPDRPYLYPKLSGRELLRFLGRLRKVVRAEERATELLRRFELTESADALVETYSHGMRQRLTFAAALLHEPRALIVDEPMVGLDPRGARDVRLLLRAFADDGGALLLTTHSMEVAEAVSDRVLLMTRGKIVAQGALAELRSRVGSADASLEAIFLQITAGETA